MEYETWLIYVTTVLVLMSTPGPSQLLVMSNSLSSGFRRSLLTACGDLTANLLQMLAAGLGVAGLLASSPNALNFVKWAGVAYLLFLGIKMLRSSGTNDIHSQAAIRPRLRALWMQGFLTSIVNPKAVAFFASLFPLFILEDRPFWPQFAILSITYLIMDGCFLTTYAGFSHALASRIEKRGRVRLNHFGGAMMILAALLLGLKFAK